MAGKYWIKQFARIPVELYIAVKGGELCRLLRLNLPKAPYDG